MAKKNDTQQGSKAVKAARKRREREYERLQQAQDAVSAADDSAADDSLGEAQLPAQDAAQEPLLSEAQAARVAVEKLIADLDRAAAELKASAAQTAALQAQSQLPSAVDCGPVLPEQLPAAVDPAARLRTLFAGVLLGFFGTIAFGRWRRR
jgi:hypothetical protein